MNPTTAAQTLSALHIVNYNYLFDTVASFLTINSHNIV